MVVWNSGAEFLTAAPFLLVLSLLFLGIIIALAGRVRNHLAFVRFLKRELLDSEESVELDKKDERHPFYNDFVSSSSIQERVLGAVVCCGKVLCVECLSSSVALDDPKLTLITPESGYKCPPVCSFCGHVHEDLFVRENEMKGFEKDRELSYERN